MNYRADIDGLRAIAVIPVVLFHLGVWPISGGFAGVDIFFVISGFLITTLVVKEIKADEFSLMRFYERRIRRLFPALFTVMIVTLICAYFLLVPEDLYNAAQSAIAATFFASNLLFYWEAGYFDASSYSKPFLHTWSLAVEEQFYIFFPLLALLLWKLRANIGLWIAIISAASLALSILSTTSLPTAAYYLLPWRAWELGFGAVLALGLVPAFQNKMLAEISGILGVALIAMAVFGIDQSTPFPGVAALLPVVGAALIIHSGSNASTLTSRSLSNVLPVFIGKISYSLYLWHWPIIVLFTYWALDMPNMLEQVGIFVVSIAIATISWRFIEQPFRVKNPKSSSLKVVNLGGITALVVVAIAAIPVALKGFPDRFPKTADKYFAAKGDRDARYHDCVRLINRNENWGDVCVYGDTSQPRAKVALWGDSHAAALIPALDVAGQNSGVGVKMYARLSCPGILDLELFGQQTGQKCTDFVDTTSKLIMQDVDIELVVIALRAALYVHGPMDYGFMEKGRAKFAIGSTEGPLSSRLEHEDFLIGQLTKTIEALKDAGKDVVLVYPTPESGNHVPDALLRVSLLKGDVVDLTIPRDLFEKRNLSLLERYDQITQEQSIQGIRPYETLCNADDCKFYLDGQVLFYDATHLSTVGAKLFAPEFENVFKRLN